MADHLRVIFMGTPDFAVPALRMLIDHPDMDVIAVYSQPPRPKGRGHQVQLSPVHQAAEENGIPVHNPHHFKKDESAQIIFAGLQADIAVVAAYGLILPLAVLDAPRHGCVNIHASLLPRWRGASPIQHAIWHGDTQSGVGIMQMEAGLDTGPVLAQRAVPIRETTTAQSLHDELAALGGALCVEVLEQIAASNKPQAVPQDNANATYAPLLKKEDGIIDWAADARAIDRQIRALNPWPGVWTRGADGKRLKILSASPADMAVTDKAGIVTDRAGHIACGNGSVLKLGRVQPENGKAMDIVAAINGSYLRVGESLG